MNEEKYQELKKTIMNIPVSYLKRLEKDLHIQLIKESKSVHNPESVYHNYLYKYRNKKQEHFIVLLLDCKNKIIKTHVATVGLLNSTQIHPREVFIEAIKRYSASIIIAHNHPSGNNDPSQEDLEITKKIKEAGEIMGIPVLDHVVFSKAGYYSMRENGQI